MSSAFTALDLLVLVAYLAGTTWLGIYLGRDQKDAKDYFIAGQRIPWRSSMDVWLAITPTRLPRIRPMLSWSRTERPGTTFARASS